MGIVAQVTQFTARAAGPADLDAARALMVRTFEEDFGYGPETGLEDLHGAYLDDPRALLLVAVDDTTEELMATAAVKPWNRRHPTHPDWLHARYAIPTVAELARVYTAREHSRRGAARKLVELARQWVVAEGFYTILMLHTNVEIPGAEAFWRSVAVEVFDARPSPHNTVHFEIPLNRPVPGTIAPTGAQ
jgi:GNAT superfamily N-acetyltransferase